MASIGWIDFSSEHREKVRTVLDLLKKQGVVDELGIGVIRDSFADRMFPGASTIQTRAKYFVLTARLIRDYEEQPARKKLVQSLEQYLAEWEKWCRIRLAHRYADQGEALGIIGISFGERKDRDVQRPPSSVYWNGMRTFGILRTRLSLTEYSRAVSGGRGSLKVLLEATHYEKGDDVDADEESGPRVRIPDEVDDNYWNNLSITLTQPEAEFLRQQITACVPESLLGQILLDDQAIKQLLLLKKNSPFAQFAELPFIAGLKHDLPRVVSQARDFWILFEGAHIRYNYLLQDRFGTAEGKSQCEDDWNSWRDRVAGFNWSGWKSDFLWELVELHGSRVARPTRCFVNGWIDRAREKASNLEEIDKLVIDQERANKRGRARLRPGVKDERVDSWIGLSVLDYRFPQVRALVEDIRRAETEEADPDAGR
jgi:hypothetical protein